MTDEDEQHPTTSHTQPHSGGRSHECEFKYPEVEWGMRPDPGYPPDYPVQISPASVVEQPAERASWGPDQLRPSEASIDLFNHGQGVTVEYAAFPARLETVDLDALPIRNVPISEPCVTSSPTEDTATELLIGTTKPSGANGGQAASTKRSQQRRGRARSVADLSNRTRPSSQRRQTGQNGPPVNTRALTASNSRGNLSSLGNTERKLRPTEGRPLRPPPPPRANVFELPSLPDVTVQTTDTVKPPIKRVPSRPGFNVPFPRKDPKEGVRRWYKFDQHGLMTIVQADKYEVMQQLGVHTRDLRILDPSLTSSYPSCVLCREHAVVVNLEFIQVIITADTTLVLNAENDKIRPFVEDLQRRLSSNNNVPYTRDALDNADGDTPTLHKHTLQFSDITTDVPKETSYELKVLEVCLDHIAIHMAALVTVLEKSAYPALDSLTQRVTPTNLENVRKVKNRMVRLNTRVETIRQLLEKYLDDDEDMRDLNLTGKRHVAALELQKANEREECRREDYAKYVAKRAAKLEEDWNASISSFSSSSDSSETEDRHWLSEEVEMLIEPYFMSFDNTWNRLQTLAEYIDDTEDLINITLDSHRNKLIQVDLLLTAATFCLTIVTLVAGIFGMNLRSGLESDTQNTQFLIVSIGASMASVILLIMFVVTMRWHGLAFD